MKHKKGMYKLLVFATILGVVFCDQKSHQKNQIDKDEETLPPACQMPPDTSDCGGKEERWFYHAELMTCTQFTYKGCGNSANNFAYKDECEKLCLSSEHRELSAFSKDILSPDSESQSTVDENKGKGETKIHSKSTQIRDRGVEKEVKEKTQENSDNSEKEKKHGKDADRVVDEINKDGNLEADEDEEVTQLIEQQEELEKAFGMADSQDLLTLEQYMQDGNIDLGEIVKEEEAGEISEGDIKGQLYGNVNNIEDDSHEKHTQEFEETYISQDKQSPQEDESEKAETEESNDTANHKQKKENTSVDESFGVLENTQSEDAGSELEDTEEYLNKADQRYPMANSDDMLALQEIMQAPDMEIEELVEPSDVSEEERNEYGKTEHETNQNEGRYEDNDVDITEASKRRQQFSMADDGDYITLEELMSSPHVEEMEIVQENMDFGGNGGDIRIAHMKFDGDSVQHARQEVEHINSNESKLGHNEDNYSEHLDKSLETNPGNSEKEEDEIEATLNFEKELEQRFNMADREDMLSLEGIIQDPNTDLAELIPSDKAGEKQDGDINGVLSLAASFLGEDHKEESENLEQLSQDISQLPEIAGQPLDYTHPAERLERKPELKQSAFPTFEIKAMEHDDKMMLMSLLHIDRLKVHKLAGTTPPVLSPFDDESTEIVSGNSSSPKQDLLEVISIKQGIKKCCLLPKDPGPCKDKRFLQWHYDPVLRTCLPFFYGGCKGNKNRFDTIGECLRTCGITPREKEDPTRLPEPIPEPPVSPQKLRSFSSLKSMITDILPGKIMSIKDKMSPGQQKFIHKFIKSALSHVSDIKPVKISHFPIPVSGMGSQENMLEINKRRDRLPMPIKSIIFKWPILRMVFDKTNKELKERSFFRDESFPPLPTDKLFPAPSRDFVNFRGFGKDWRENKNDFQEYNKIGKDWGREGVAFKEYRKMGNDWRREGRDDIKAYREVGDDRGRDNFREYKKLNKEWRKDKDSKRSKHFSPTFKKSYQMMSHHDDNRHQINSDPKNKVNLIQVFVNKPHTETHSNPSHHHTMIKKEYKPVQPQVKTPRHIPPTLPQTYPGLYVPPQVPPKHPSPLPNLHSPLPSSQSPALPHQQPRPNHLPHFPPPPPIRYHPQHFDSHHHHPPPHTHYHMHTHPHPPLVPNYGPPPFFQPPRPWWSRFGRPYFEPQFNDNRRFGGFPSMKPEIRNTEETDDNETEAKDNMMIVTVPQTELDVEIHYACLLPVSTGLCKAFMERFYFNKATGSCEMFIYGGCGGNANNFENKAQCEATCISKSGASQQDETTTVPDDTLIVTSPVYVPNQNEVDNGEDTTSREQTEKLPTSDLRGKETDNEKGTVKIHNDIGVSEKDTDKASDKEAKETDTQEGHDAVKIEPVSLFQSSNTEYIIVVAVMCFVGLSAIVLVALAIANLSRRLTKSKKEKVVAAVLASHLDARSSGSITPRMSFYGQPPSELGPPPISEVLKLHASNTKEIKTDD